MHEVGTRPEIRASHKDVAALKKDASGKVLTRLDTQALGQEQLTWIARTIDTLHALQGVET